MKDRDVKRTERKVAGEIFPGQTMVVDGSRFRVDRRRPDGRTIKFTEFGFGKRKPRVLHLGRKQKVDLVHR